MPPSSDTAQPLIEVIFSRSALRRYAAILPLSLLLVLGMIGATVSPLVNQHPVLLTRERLVILRYLEAVQNSVQHLDEIAARMETLSSAPLATSNNAHRRRRDYDHFGTYRVAAFKGGLARSGCVVGLQCSRRQTKQFV